MNAPPASGHSNVIDASAAATASSGRHVNVTDTAAACSSRNSQSPSRASYPGGGSGDLSVFPERQLPQNQRRSVPAASTPSPEPELPHSPTATPGADGGGGGGGKSVSSSSNRFSISSLPTWAKKVWKPDSVSSRGGSPLSSSSSADGAKTGSKTTAKGKRGPTDDDNSSASDSASGSTRSGFCR